MKNIILVLIVLFITNPGTSISQGNYFSNPVRLTNGSNDRDASFRNQRNRFFFGAFAWEFMIFERVSSGSSQICVAKIGSEGAIDSAYYLTNDSFININPSITYSEGNFSNGFMIRTALAVWQSNKFGRQSIIGNSYRAGIGWSLPFVIDSSNSDNQLPKVYSLDSTNYIIVYQSGNDIKYKKYNVITNQIMLDGNLTTSDTSNCGNPQLGTFTDMANNLKIIVTYEREISPTQKGIYYKTGFPDSIPTAGNANDTIAFVGWNTNNGGFNHLTFADCSIFESNRNGKINIFGTEFGRQTSEQFPIISSSQYDCFNYAGTNFAIFDAGGFTNYIYVYDKRQLNRLDLILMNFGQETSLNISNNLLYQTKNAINNSIRVPNFPCERFWFVFNKDSLNPNFPSTIYGVYFTNCATNINTNSANAPDKFSLSQNYPNPFNPNTIISYSIPSNGKLETANVKLVIFDVSGKEVATLVNQKQNAGTYSVQFDGSNYRSGIYFYKLQAKKFSETKRMILLK